jgi:transposase-like protein
MSHPKTLQEAIIFYADPENCRQHMVASRWPDGVECPTCGRTDVSYLTNQKKWQCKSAHAKRQFTAKVGTIFEDSPLGLDKWLPASWMIANCKNGISSYELARALGVTQKTAWFMLHRIRLAMGDNCGMIGGSGAPVEIDETFVGGKVKNMHKSKRPKGVSLKGGSGKAIVLGMLERGGSVKAHVIANRHKHSIDHLVTANVVEGANIHTDEFPVYPNLTTAYIHEVVNHADHYVRDHIHTNGIENFWALLKRGLHGTYISVEPFHLNRYVEEQVFRYNNRKNMNDAQRFNKVLSQVAGKRLTYAEATGKVGETKF